MKRTTKLVLLVIAFTAAESGVATADAGTITWHWAGTVTGYSGANGGPSLETVVPRGTPIDVMLSFDPAAPYLNPATCLQSIGSASLQFLGRTYTGGGYVWVDAMGFGPGVCAPSFDHVEVVVPSWGFNGPELPDGWVTFGQDLPGLWWGGDLTTVQPSSISAQFPLFYRPREAAPQRFFANLQAVPTAQPIPAPEPGTMAMVGIGLALAARQRRRRQRGA